MWEAEQVEYRGYDPVVSAVRGRRREGFRSRSVADPYTQRLDIYTAYSSDMTPVRTVPEWCDAVRPYSANICSAIKSESRFISDHEPDMDARRTYRPRGPGEGGGVSAASRRISGPFAGALHTLHALPAEQQEELQPCDPVDVPHGE